MTRAKLDEARHETIVGIAGCVARLARAATMTPSTWAVIATA